jgi:hypothetical protein
MANDPRVTMTIVIAGLRRASTDGMNYGDGLSGRLAAVTLVGENTERDHGDHEPYGTWLGVDQTVGKQSNKSWGRCQRQV